jgi:hypothetical protein
MSGKTTAL